MINVNSFHLCAEIHVFHEVLHDSLTHFLSNFVKVTLSIITPFLSLGRSPGQFWYNLFMRNPHRKNSAGHKSWIWADLVSFFETVHLQNGWYEEFFKTIIIQRQAFNRDNSSTHFGWIISWLIVMAQVVSISIFIQDRGHLTKSHLYFI